ncbi:MAG: 1-acyl-sn-glycerol-3-phosphate acyltransferase [Bradymonadaceae bacterium]|nr:1-acyl-sn-glycerol-3-phosphate acyltransferase [Lujinxingiaceae bacterium]
MKPKSETNDSKESAATPGGAPLEERLDSMLPEGLPMLEGGLAESSEAEVASTAIARHALAEKLRAGIQPSAMLTKMSRVLRFIGRLLFAHVLFEQRCVDNIRDADRRGNVVYVMQTRSLLDYLYFNYAFLQHDLPIARFANSMNINWLRGFSFWLGNLFRRGSKERSEIQMEALASHGEPVFLFLEKARQEADEAVDFSQKYLLRLIRAQRASAEPVYAIPMLLVWEKRPDPRRAGFLDDVFGTVQSPGFFRKFLYYFQTVWQSFLKFGQPMVQVSSGINLREFLREYPNAGSSDAAELLRDRLNEHIRQERQVVLGPTGVSRETIYKELIARPELTDTIKRVAAEEAVSEELIRKRARKQYDEIASEPSLLMLKIFNSVLSLVWYRIYDGFEVDHEGLEAVREAAKSSSVVLIPSHKSHIDYLVISYIFYQYGLTPPHIAAGVNLSFWPMGWIFRRAGAFFLRRSFKGDELYPVVFREYLIRLMEEGYPIEFFIEGTRSRTGKLIKPRYGMLDMMIRAYVSGRIESLKFVPISVGYEKIIEERSYRRELLGEEKEKESLTGLLKTPKLLASKYGRLYVEFDEPIDLGEYLEKYGVQRHRAEAAELDALTVRLAHRIIFDINRVTTVSPTALAATVLLNNPVRGTDRLRFLQEVGFLLHFLTQPGRTARLSGTLRDALSAKRTVIKRLEQAQRLSDGGEAALIEGAARGPVSVEAVMGEAVASIMDSALAIFAANKQVVITREGDETFFSMDENARLDLSYYRNTLVHYFVPEALLATAILRFQATTIDHGELMAETLFLSRLFKYEWIYAERAEFENVFGRTLAYFEASSWVKIEGDEADLGRRVVVAEPAAELEFFRRMVLTFLEAYAIVASFLPELGQRPIEHGELVKAAIKQGKNDFLRGRIIFYESLSKPTFVNALRLLVDWGVLEKRVEPGRKRETVYYALAETWRESDQHLELVAKLNAFVYQGVQVGTPRILP